MAFRPANFARLARFNSATSSDFLDLYTDTVDNEIIAQNAEPKHQTFAPSAFRCPRVSWFRLRGVQPDKPAKPDRVMQFTADIGTACHELIQSRLSTALKDDWIDVGKYLEESKVQYKYELEKSGYETHIEIFDPPVRFACDGIVRWRGEYYLLEIKTSEFSSWDELTSAKPQHIDQIKFYATLLNLDKVLVMYQDRQYGEIKCYEMHISSVDKQEILNKIKYVQEMVECNLAPSKLPKDDPWCTAAHCPYYQKCKEW